jgi:hypothetical protein
MLRIARREGSAHHTLYGASEEYLGEPFRLSGLSGLQTLVCSTTKVVARRFLYRGF